MSSPASELRVHNVSYVKIDNSRITTRPRSNVRVNLLTPKYSERTGEGESLNKLLAVNQILLL